MLGVYELDERHTSEYVSNKLVEVCADWNISQENVVAVIMDGVEYDQGYWFII